MLRDIGKRVSVGLPDGSNIEGWLYGKIPQGDLIAEDAEGSRIRLVQGTRSRTVYSNAPRANFAPANLEQIEEQINNLDEKLQPRMEIALKKLDLRPLQRFIYRAPQLYRAISRTQEYLTSPTSSDFEDNPSNELFYLIAARADEAVELHSEVFNELEQSGIADIVSEHAQELTSLPAKYTLPSIDAVLGDVSQLRLETGESVGEGTWSIQQHRSDLDGALRAREQAVFQFMSPSKRAAASGQQRRPGGTLTRYIGASLQIVVGSVAVAMNPFLGMTAGLASTCVTMGATAVPTYVGVVASVGSGLAIAGAGFKYLVAAATPGTASSPSAAVMPGISSSPSPVASPT
jgi:hypothetical protein